MSYRHFVTAVGLVLATTIGAGIFALPLIFSQGGVLLGVLYLIAVTVLIGAVHAAYYDVLVTLHERHRLLGLVKEHLGKASYRPALFIIVGELFLALVAYLILSATFLQIVFPALPFWTALLLFWVIASAPVFFELRRLVGVEFLGAALMLAIVFVIHVTASGIRDYSSDLVLVNPSLLLLPFGPIVFALAGWTAIEPVFDLRKRNGLSPKIAKRAILLGTALAAFIYFIFVVAIFGSGGTMTPDTLSGLSHWASWKIGLLVLFGLFAIFTSYAPMSLEIVNSLNHDVGWSREQSIMAMLIVPPALVALGLHSFLGLVGFIGGVLLSLQYVCIALLAKRILRPTLRRALLLNTTIVIFSLAAVYEISSFVLDYVL